MYPHHHNSKMLLRRLYVSWCYSGGVKWKEPILISCDVSRLFFLPPPPHLQFFIIKLLFALSECHENRHANKLGHDKHIWSS